MQFVSLRHRDMPPILQDSFSSRLVISQYSQLFDQYARVLDLNLDISDGFLRLNAFLARLETLMWRHYESFHFKIVYFASVSASLLLFASVLAYATLHKRLMMPRSFYHSLLNIWTCVLLLTLVYSFGIFQVNLPHLCFSTAVLLHYLTLCAFVWYTLFFYCMHQKLRTLQTRNFSLIFRRGEATFAKQEPNTAQIGGAEYVKKSVVHLYMLGWGVPSLVCSVIVSVTKREYVQAPYAYCFTNEPHILIGSVLVPVLTMLVVQLVFVVLIGLTLRKIVGDLKEDKEESDQSNEAENPRAGLTMDELNDKVELCKKWAQTKTNGSINGRVAFFITCIIYLTEKELLAHSKEKKVYNSFHSILNKTILKANN